MADAGQQLAVVDRFERLPGDRIRMVHLVGTDEPVGPHPLVQARVLVEREAMVAREREAAAVVGPDVHADRQ